MNTTLKNVGKYQILAELGRGGLGIIYHAHDPYAKRDVAIRLLKPTSFSNDTQRQSFNQVFLTATAIVGKLNHPHIVGIYDAVVDGEQNYIVMELVQGTSLDAHVEIDHLLPIQTIMQYMFKCCVALDSANGQGLIHSDLNPANIMYTKAGEIKIADFGNALMAKKDDYIEVADLPAYLSPEQASDGHITHQADIYSLGVVMFRLLTGRLPYDATDNFSYVDKVLHAAPLNIRELRPEIPEKLAAIVHQMMEKNLANRYYAWVDVASDLASCVALVDNEAKVIADSEKFDALKKLPFFKNFNDVELWEVIRISEWAKFLSGKTLVREGDFGTSFFLLIKGKVHVTKMGKTLTTLEKGDCFGEMAYIDKSKAERSASIISAMPVLLMKIKAEVLEQSSEQLQLCFNRAFLKVLVHRLALANSNIATRFDAD
jgi:eukaryotic-like serine/threonine-protein kinase